MPINYKKYPPDWLKEIRPRIMARAGNICEGEGCDFGHGETVFSVKYKGRTTGWFRDLAEAELLPRTVEGKAGKLIPNPKPVKVVLTVAHLDHDETNHDVADERLKALCQLCHLRYDAKEKWKRQVDKAKK